MTKILVEKTIIDQALKVLEVWSDAYVSLKGQEVITAMRESLGYCIDEGCPHHGTTHECTNPLVEQAEQEPVAWMNTNGAVNKLREAGWAMNAAPVRTKDLTDDEILEITKRFALGIAFPVDGVTTPEMFARAVIAADRKKNNV